MSVVVHISKLVGTRSETLVYLTKEMFQEQDTAASARITNITADFLSRHFRDRTDWILNTDIFKALNLRWGPIQVDMFVTR